MREQVDAALWDGDRGATRSARRSRSASADDTGPRRRRDRRADRHVRGPATTPSLIQNRCFLYHLIGNGTGEWRVPVGGMGAVTDGAAAARHRAGCRDRHRRRRQQHRAERGRRRGHLARRAPGALRAAHDTSWPMSRPGCCGSCSASSEDAATQARGRAAQDQLPARPAARAEGRSSTRAVAFAGTFHVAEDYSAARAAYARGRRRLDPDRPCRARSTATRSPTPRSWGTWPGQGVHTLTYFGLHMPGGAVRHRPGRPARRGRASARSPRSTYTLQSRSMDCVAHRRLTAGPASRPRCPRTSRTTSRCRAATSSTATSSGRGQRTGQTLDTPAQQWGVATDSDTVLLCGSGARRGGAVSGLGGHNAAHAVLASR